MAILPSWADMVGFLPLRGEHTEPGRPDTGDVPVPVLLPAGNRCAEFLGKRRCGATAGCNGKPAWGDPR
jgi:hypothetical protein